MTLAGSDERNERKFTIQISDPGRMVRLPALLAELGLPAGDLPRQTREQTLVVRMRARCKDGEQALARACASHFAQASAEQPQQSIYTLVCTRAALDVAARDLSADGDVLASALGTELGEALVNATEPVPFNTQIGKRLFHWGQRTYVMGIINVTPDSFSGDGILARDATGTGVTAAAVEQALRFVQQGVDLVDIGAESTRPGAEPVPPEVERERLLPVIAAIRRETDIPISVDTYKASVAQAALAEGADMVNDVWGLQADADMGAVLAGQGVPAILMHNRARTRAMTSATLGGRYVGVRYADLVLDVLEALGHLVDTATAQGVMRRSLIVDPGLGFAKTVGHSLRLVHHADALRVLGLPILLGPSRKSFVGYTANVPADQRVHGTMAAIAVAIARGGVDIVRVHDVPAAVQAVTLADAIVGTAAPSLGALDT